MRRPFSGLAGFALATLATCNVEAVFRANMRELGVIVEVLVERSTIAAQRFAPKSIDRIFLDGSHDGASVREDLAAWIPPLR